MSTSITKSGILVANGIGIGENLVSGVIAGGRTTVVDTYTVQTTGEDKDTYFLFNITDPFISGLTYTISVSVEKLLYDNGLVFSVGSQDTTSDKYCGRFYLNNGYNVFTFICPIGLDGLTQSILDDVIRSGAIGQNVLISNFKLEKGPVATPWIPNAFNSFYKRIEPTAISWIVIEQADPILNHGYPTMELSNTYSNSSTDPGHNYEVGFDEASFGDNARIASGYMQAREFYED